MGSEVIAIIAALLIGCFIGITIIAMMNVVHDSDTVQEKPEIRIKIMYHGHFNAYEIDRGYFYARGSFEPSTKAIAYEITSCKDFSNLKHGDWIDLRAAETIVMKQGEYKLIPLGVAMQLPHGYEAIVAPRSSTPSKFGIVCANSIGIIDNDYNGDNDEWKFPAIAIRDTVIQAGDRICQFRIVKNQPAINFELVTQLGNQDRGGIGSTGTK